MPKPIYATKPMNCEEHVCVKGDEIKTAFLRKRLEEAKGFLADAEKASKKGYTGSDRWIDHHNRTVERLSQLNSILEDPKIPIGSVIQLSHVQASSQIEIDQAAQSRLSHDYGHQITGHDIENSRPLLRNLLSEMKE